MLEQVAPGKFYFDYDADTIYFADDPTGRRVETSITATAFENTGDDVTISGLVVERYASTFSHGVLDGTDCTGWIVSSNDVRWNHSTGIRVGSRAQVRGNRVHHNGQLGIFASGDDVVVENNEIAYNNRARYEVTYEAAGTKFVGTRNLIVRGNYAHHNVGPGLWSDLDNIDTLYEDNVSQDNEWMGIWYEISYRATIRNNIIRRNGFAHPNWLWGAGILVAGSSDVDVYGNFLEGNADGIGGIEQDRGRGVYGAHDIWNLWVHHNTVIGTDGWSAGIVQDRSNPAVYSRNNRFDFNRYRLRPGSQNGAPYTWMDGYRTPAQWLATGMDMSGLLSQPQAETVSFLSDRGWMSAASGWGPVERDRSNGEAPAGDGRTITVARVPYTRGLGVHAPSDLRYVLGGSCSAFTAIVGVDDELGALGSVTFQVWTDGVLRYDSGVRTGGSAAQGVFVDITGANQLSLVVTDGGDGPSYDHADWADAQVSCR
jgi:parallel beta-helix repeat protein